MTIADIEVPAERSPTELIGAGVLAAGVPWGKVRDVILDPVHHDVMGFEVRSFGGARGFAPACCTRRLVGGLELTMTGALLGESELAFYRSVGISVAMDVPSAVAVETT